MTSSATPASGASPKPRRPRNSAASTPGIVSGNIPFSVQVDPLNMRVAAQLVGTGQPVSQPAPAAQAPISAKKSVFASYWVHMLVACAFLVAGFLAVYNWQSSKPSAVSAAAASANVQLSVPPAPQQVASAPAATTPVVTPPAPAMCPTPAVSVVNTNNCGVSPEVKPPVVHPTARPTLRPQQPQTPAPTTIVSSTLPDCTFTDRHTGRVQNLKVPKDNDLGVAVTTGDECRAGRAKLEKMAVAAGAQVISRDK